MDNLGHTHSLHIIYYGDNHLILSFLEHMSGRLKTRRVQVLISKECFYGLFINYVNEAIFSDL